MNRLSEDNNHYIIGKETYPRLSLITESDNPGLRAWRDRVGIEEAERISKEASDWGTAVHLITRLSDEKKHKAWEKMIKEDESLLIPLLAWQGFVSTCIVKWYAIERVVWSKRLKVAGTIDRVGLYRGDASPSILDIKTGSLVDDIGIKLGGYKIMWNERQPKRKVERYLAIQLPRRDPGNVKAKEYTNPAYEDKFEEKCKAYHEMYG